MHRLENPVSAKIFYSEFYNAGLYGTATIRKSALNKKKLLSVRVDLKPSKFTLRALNECYLLRQVICLYISEHWQSIRVETNERTV